MSATKKPSLSIFFIKNNSVDCLNELASKIISLSLISSVEIFKSLIESLFVMRDLIETFVFTVVNGNFLLLKIIVGLRVFISNAKFFISNNILTVFKSIYMFLLIPKTSFLILLLNFVVLIPKILKYPINKAKRKKIYNKNLTTCLIIIG